MGRGSSEQRKLAQQQLEIQNQWIQQQREEKAQARSRLIPEAEKLLGDQGYSPEEQSGILQSAMEPIGTVFDTARAGAERRQARTRNTAGYGEMVSEMSRQEAREKARAARETTTQFADEKQRRRLAGLQYLGNIYGVDTNLLQSTAGLPIGSLGQHAQGIAPGFWDYAMGAIGAGADVASSFFAPGAKKKGGT